MQKLASGYDFTAFVLILQKSMKYPDRWFPWHLEDLSVLSI